jgi:putative tricarboxylic transport membrane protein
VNVDILNNLAEGFRITFVPLNLLLCFVGVLIGTLIGVLPGIGPTGTVALLLPVTFSVPPVSAIILLSGVYYGAQYGGSTTSILVNIPGEPASIVTCLDGYQMARQGRAGAALGISAFGSFIAGTLGLMGLMVFARPLANAALKFGPPEYFALMCLGLNILIFLARRSMIKSLIMAGFGLFLSFIGTDVISGRPRFTLGVPELLDGIGLIPVAMGLFGISEVLLNVEEKMVQEFRQDVRIKGLLPNAKDWRDSAPSILRGSVVGFLLGILPGAGAVIASFVCYAIEKKVSKHPEKFGTGIIQGVAGPESANNAASSGSFIPLFSLGIPASPVMAMLLGALIIHGLTPGPALIREQPGLFWGTIASMYVGNLLLLILNLPLIGMWVKILRIPYPILFPLILLFCIIGTFTINYSFTDVFIMIVSGILGYFFRKLEYETAPLILAFVLAPMLERTFRQSLIISDGSAAIFLKRPISAAAFLLIVALLSTSMWNFLRKSKKDNGIRTETGHVTK